MTTQLITVDTNNEIIAQFATADAVYGYINQSLGKYADLAGLTFNWQKGKSLSKMVSEAQDLANPPVEKKARPEQFRRIRAIFVNEGLNDLLEATFRAFGAKAQFTNVTKSGIANFKFVPPVLANGKQDAVLKMAQGMAIETRAARTEKGVNALGYDVHPETGELVKRLE